MIPSFDQIRADLTPGTFSGGPLTATLHADRCGDRYLFRYTGPTIAIRAVRQTSRRATESRVNMSAARRVIADQPFDVLTITWKVWPGDTLHYEVESWSAIPELDGASGPAIGALLARFVTGYELGVKAEGRRTATITRVASAAGLLAAAQLAGWVLEHAAPAAALPVTAGACTVAAAVAVWLARRRRRQLTGY